MLGRRRISKMAKRLILGLPLIAAVIASFFTLSDLAHQFLILIVLLWLYVFFVSECYLVEKQTDEGKSNSTISGGR